MTSPLTQEQQELFEKLKPLQKEIALNKLEGMNDIDAYKASNGKAKTDSAQRASVCEILANPNVMSFISSIQNTQLKNTIMNREEALERLSNMARANLSELVNFRTVEHKDADGNTVRQAVWDIPDSEDQEQEKLAWIAELKTGNGGITVKLHDAKTAIKQLADMEGWNAATKNININKEVKEMNDEELDRTIAQLTSELEQED